MTGGLGEGITASRKTLRLNDLFVSQTHDFRISMMFMLKIVLIAGLFGAVACAPAVVTPLPQNLHRIAVLPPYQAGAVDARTGADSGLPNMTVGDVLAQQARIRLAEKGFEVLSPSAVKVATQDRVPTSPEMAAQILREANLDAVALYIEVRRWSDAGQSRHESRRRNRGAGRGDGGSENRRGTVAGTPSLPPGPSLWRRINGPS